MKTTPSLVLIVTTVLFTLGGCASSSRTPGRVFRDAEDHADEVTQQWIDDLEAGMRQFRIDVDKALVDDLW